MTQTPLFQDQRVKGQGHQAALLSAALTRKAAAAVSIGNVFGVGKYCYVASARRRARRLGAHGTGEGRGHIVSPRAQLGKVNILRLSCASRKSAIERSFPTVCFYSRILDAIMFTFSRKLAEFSVSRVNSANRNIRRNVFNPSEF